MIPPSQVVSYWRWANGQNRSKDKKQISLWNDELPLHQRKENVDDDEWGYIVGTKQRALGYISQKNQKECSQIDCSSFLLFFF